jgi:hypothetical protein
MEEVDEVPIAVETTPVAEGSKPAATSVIPVIPVVGTPELDFSAQEGYSLLQKGLFLGVILGCVAVYLRINSTKKAKQYEEKSMA